MNQNGKQIGGMFLSPDIIENPKLAARYLQANVEMGYNSIIVFVRHEHRNVLSVKVHDAVRDIVAQAHGLGLKVLLDTDHCWWGAEFVESHPEAAMWVIIPVEAAAVEGRFEFLAPFPQLSGQVLFQEIAAVSELVDGSYRSLDPARVEVAAMSYFHPRPGLALKGRIAGLGSAELLFHVAVRVYGTADVAHPAYLKAQEALLDAYADIPLDGFGWDEPGKGHGDMSSFKAGAGFLALFQELCGYDLRPKLVLLDHFDGTPEAVKVRHDYYSSLVEMNYRAQKRHNDHASKLFGHNLMFGTHNTWSGFAPDLAAGIIDYFKLGRNQTAAWTDGGWCYELKYPLHNYMLAEGLKKELMRRDAYYNDWGTRPVAAEDIHLAMRLKMLFHVNWFNHCVSEFSEDLLNFTQEPLKSVATEEARMLDRFDQLVGDSFHPHTDVALLYNWQTLAIYPKWLTRSFYTFIANASLHLVDKGLYAAIMSGDGLLSAAITPGKGFTVNGFFYRVLVAPYVGAVPAAVYAKMMEICAAGIPVVVVGPPPEFAAETGAALGADFAGRVGMKPFGFGAYAKVFARQCPLPGVNEWEPCWIDVVYSVESLGAELTQDREGHLSYAKSAKLPLYYMPGPDPREDLMTLLSSLVRPAAELFADDAYCRIFPHRNDPAQTVVVAVAKGNAASFGLTPDRYGVAVRPPTKSRQLKLLARLGGGELVLNGGTWAAARLKDGQVAELIGDCPDARWNGARI